MAKRALASASVLGAEFEAAGCVLVAAGWWLSRGFHGREAVARSHRCAAKLGGLAAFARRSLRLHSFLESVRAGLFPAVRSSFQLKPHTSLPGGLVSNETTVDESSAEIGAANTRLTAYALINFANPPTTFELFRV